MTPTTPMAPRTGLLLGGRYELTTRIAVGGMGEVWQAVDRRLGRTVAAKVLRPELVGDALFLARLRTEARNTAGLQHQNVAMLLDHGEQEGSGYLVMELVLGETLADRLDREETLSAGELVPLLVQACRGLHAAHTAGVVHRDVKPANVMITPEGTVKLTDFGISLGTNQAPMTSAGMVMGTAQYLPPEQAMGRAATPAGDVYALGILAYECLVGHRPFTGSTQVDIAFAHVNQPLPPLPASVPAPVAAVVERMLAKDPAGRPASALVCARELEAALYAGSPRRSRRGQPEPRNGSSAVRTLLATPPTATRAAPGPARARSAESRPASTPARTRSAESRPASTPARTRSAGSRSAVATPEVVSPAVPVIQTRRELRSAGGRSAELRRRAVAVRRKLVAVVGRLAPDVDPADPARRQGAAPASRWRLPTWAELASDRVWLGSMAVILLVLTILVAAALGSLGGADSSAAGGPAVPYPTISVKDD
ncbi:serine/threonine-protein kinase [Georgenia soli]|uniref:non-specific serine/threonine protein kinase n=1 Tax=Georgenia soli TaxID=638953 RepID=A0A2A9EMC9_9MICO|nr:serine/threonine-protein kinase [Georgenia soli]PFG39766.1 serine/threonine-protein kinase [Georgenia soli]